MGKLAVELIGLLAQGLFSGRMIVQWILSERAKKVVSPVIFWQMSMAASFLLCLYGWLGNDFVIILGQIVAYYVYVWNLHAKGSWQQMHFTLRWLFFLTPIVLGAWLLIFHWDLTMEHLFVEPDIPMWLFIYGIVGQLVFSLRFIYQWIYSQRRGEWILDYQLHRFAAHNTLCRDTMQVGLPARAGHGTCGVFAQYHDCARRTQG